MRLGEEDGIDVDEEAAGGVEAGVFWEGVGAGFGDEAGGGGAEEELPAPAVLFAFEGGGDGWGDVEAGVGFEAAFGGLCALGDGGFVGAGEGEAGEAGVGGEFLCATVEEFFAGEGFVVAVAGGLDGGVFGEEGLDVDFAGEVAAAGASGDLCDELEGAFGGAEVVGDGEGAIGGEDANEGDIGEVEALGNHLGAEEDVGLFGAEGGEEFVVAMAAGGGVGIHPDDAGGGEDGVEGGLDALGAEAELLEAGGVAGGAGGGRAAPETAEVAAEGVVLGVVGKLGCAVGATEHFTAGLALEGGGVAAAVEEEDGLFAAGEAGADGFDERFAEDGGALAGLAGLAHVDGIDGGEGAAADALGHSHEGVFAGLGGVVPALEGGGGRAEDAAGALDDCAHHGHIAGAVAGAFVLLVAAVVLFIDNHEPELADRGEDG